MKNKNMKKENRKKKVISVLLTAVMALSLTACGSANVTQTEAKNETVKTETTQEETAKTTGESKNEAAASETASVTASAVTESAAVEEEPTTIRVGYFSSTLWTPLVTLATELGYFEEEGLDIEALSFAAGPEVNDAILSGDLDIAFAIGDQPLVAQIARGADIVVLSRAAVQTTGSGLLVAKSISSVDELVGKPISVGIGTMPHRLILNILAQNGIEEEDVIIVNSSGIVDAIAAFENGEIYATYAQTPFTIDYYSDVAYLLLNGSDNPGSSFIYSDRTFAEEHPEQVARLLKVLIRTKDYLLEHPEESYQIIADALAVDYKKVELCNQQNEWRIGYDETVESYLKDVYDFLYSRDYITGVVDDFSQFIDFSYVEHAQELYEAEDYQ